MDATQTQTSGEQTVAFAFAGRLDPQGFAAFARHRADRLSLRLSIDRLDAAVAEMTVRGHPVLIDCFEVACALGSASSVVIDIQRAPAAP